MDAPEFVDMSSQSWEKWHGIDPADIAIGPDMPAAGVVVTRASVKIRGVPYSGDESPVSVTQTTLPEGWRNLP